MRPARSHGAAKTLVRVVVLVLVSVWSPGAFAAEPTLVDPTDGRSVPLKVAAGAHHVVFFATWCPPCLAELDVLQSLEDRWAARGYRLTLVAVETRHTEQRLTQFARSRRPPGRLLFDADGSVERALGAEGVPTHLLLDGDGHVVARADKLDDAFRDAIRTALSGGEAGRR